MTADRRVSLSGFFARSAKRCPLIDRDVIPDDRRLTDDNAQTMIDEQALADAGPRMDIHTGKKSAPFRHQPCQRFSVVPV